MTNTLTAPNLAFGEILKRVALPLLLFSAVLFGLLLLSGLLLVPRYTTFPAAGRLVGSLELPGYETDVRAKIAELLERRQASVLPIIDPQYAELKMLRLSSSHAQAFVEDVRRVAQGMEGGEAVQLTHIAIDTDDATVSLTGDVQKVGPRSMTVLARFVEQVSTLPQVGSFTTPTFMREDDAVSGAHSPFTFTLTLRAS